MSAEAVSFWATAGAASWATVQEFAPVLPKAVVGSVIGAFAAIGAAKAWLNKRRERKDNDEDR